MFIPIAVLATCSSLICIVSSEEDPNVLTLEKFDNSLTQAISNSHEENWFISPASISTALGMVYFGAQGKTKQEIAEVLGLSSDTATAINQLTNLQTNLKGSESSNVTWSIANKILVSKNAEIIPQYKNDIKTNFQSEIETVDFSTDITSDVNSWVETKTNGFIKNLLLPGDVKSETGMVLLNAVYFKGIWKLSFDSKRTRKECFYTNDNQCTQVDMMFQKNKFKYTNSEELKAQILELPYADQDYSLVVVLPKIQDGLDPVIEKLKSHNILETVKRMSEYEINVFLPKFEYEFRLDLKDTLTKLGASSMFSNDANLESMIKGQYQISKVIHKARISVFETGTIAAAATAIGVHYNLPMITDEIDFRVNGPFLYFIKNKNVILFSGQKASFS